MNLQTNLAILILTLNITLGFSQVISSRDSNDSNKKTFTMVERMPRFKRGEAAMSNFIAAKVRYPEFKRLRNIQGGVIVGFTVDKRGCIKDVKIKSGVSEGLDAEALRVVALSPKFMPVRNMEEK